MRALISDENPPEPVILKTIEFTSMDAGNKFEIDELITVSEELFDDDGDIELSINLKMPVDVGEGVTKETTVYTRQVVLHKDEASDIELTDIWVEAETVSMYQGTEWQPDISTVPHEAGRSYALHYRNRNPEIAEVDSSSGIIKAKRPGKTQIIIEAVKHENIYLMTAGNRIYRPDGTLTELEADGTPINLTKGDESSKVVLSKIITVYLLGSYEDDTVPETRPAPGGGEKSTDQNKEDGSLDSDVKVVTLDELKEVLKDSGDPGESLELTAQGGSIGFEKAALEELADSGSQLRLSLEGGEITLPPEVLKNITADTEGDTIFSLNKAGDLDGRPVFEITITTGGKRITNFGGEELFIRVPYVLKKDKDPNAVVVYYIDAGDDLRMVINGEYRDGYVIFRTNHLSKFGVGYNKKSFTDAAGWAESFISYLAARGIVNGISDRRFEPDRHVTRAEFVKMLAMMSGEPIPEDSITTFEDVDPDAWYATYIAWAAAGGYVLGVNEEKTFEPNVNIT
ncbi:MAG TPA: S-layer homology domain-containing protein [Clostridiaceae bacterium]|nr:S-layer homology domain-containing protein [Clostridiaceae bacterium]